MLTPPGGPSTINGVLYQMLWSLLRTVDLYVSACQLDRTTGAVVSATICLEPVGGGGDLQETGQAGKLVDQLKARSGSRAWSLKEVIENVLPDLYCAVRTDEDNVAYRLVTEGRMGKWMPADEFFKSLRDRPYDPTSLSTSPEDEVRFAKGRSKPEGHPFWTERFYTERSLFDKIVEVVRQRPSVGRQESLEETGKKVWHLLGRFRLVSLQTQAELQKTVDSRLLAIVGSDAELETVRDALLLDLARKAARGSATIRSSQFLAEHNLASIPWTAWPELRRRGRDLLDRVLHRRGYSASRDVRRDEVASAISHWPAQKPILLVAGESGQGKSWFLYSAAEAWAQSDQLVVFTEATGDPDRDLEHAARECRSIRDTDELLSLDRIGSRLRRLPGGPPGNWLTLLLDGVQDMEEARHIAATPWEEWGVRLAASCQHTVADWIEENAQDRCLRVSVSDFTTGQLQRVLQESLGGEWPRIPGDVRGVLRRPLLARIYLDEVAAGAAWVPANEYELFSAVWQRLYRGPQRKFPSDAVCLKRLAMSILQDRTYPWTPEQLVDVELDNEGLSRLQRIGWLRPSGTNRFEVFHDRLLNWAVAEGLVSELLHGNITEEAFLEHVRAIHQSDKTYSGRSLAYVPMDVIWLLSARHDGQQSVVEDLIDVLQPQPSYESGLFYERLLSTVGPRITLPLISRLRTVAEKDTTLLRQVVSGLVNVGDLELPKQACALLRDDSRRIQRAAMRILANKPTAQALDRLWELHVALTNDPQPFLDSHEGDWAAYKDSFGALSSCLKLDTSWLSRAVSNADPTAEPIHDLAYLLAGLERDRQLWMQCKRELFRKVPMEKERSLARCILQQRDETEVSWLEARVSRRDDLVGATCFFALATMAPDRAVASLPRLTVRDLYLTRGWGVRELLLRAPEATRRALLDILRSHEDPWRAAVVYQGCENAMNSDTLEFLLDELERLLEGLRHSPPPTNRNPLWAPLSMLAVIHDVELLTCFERHRGRQLEKRLTEWILARGPRPGAWADTEGQNGIAVLHRIGGDGYVQVVNAYLEAGSQHGRLDGLELAIKRADRSTLATLRRISVQDHLWDGKFPLEQDRAARALAAHNEWQGVIATVKRWGLKTTREVTAAVLERRRSGRLKQLAEVTSQQLLHVGVCSPGNLMALGLLGASVAGAFLETTLEAAEPPSDKALACVLALGYLEHDSPKAISLLEQQLDHHRFAAANALLRIGSREAREALLDNVEEAFDIDYALPLLNNETTRGRAVDLVRSHLVACHGLYLRMHLSLLTSATNSQSLAAILEDSALRERIRDVAFADEGGVRIGGSKPAAIRCLATFDRPMAFLAARTALRSEDEHDRERYPRILMEIDPTQAIEVILTRAATENSPSVLRSLGRALERVDVVDRLEADLCSPAFEGRLAACRLLPWQPHLDRAAVLLRAMLDDPNEDVANSARSGLEHLNRRGIDSAVLESLVSESDPGRIWVLFDSLIDVADPGEDKSPWQAWAEDACRDSPHFVRLYVGERIKKRRKELAKRK